MLPIFFSYIFTVITPNIAGRKRKFRNRNEIKGYILLLKDAMLYLYLGLPIIYLTFLLIMYHYQLLLLLLTAINLNLDMQTWIIIGMAQLFIEMIFLIYLIYYITNVVNIIVVLCRIYIKFI